jgi:hypothetical protein
MKRLMTIFAAMLFAASSLAATKISELPSGQKVGNILDETLRVGGGATTSTTPTLTVPRDDSSTNTVPTLLRLQRTSSGTPATGIGAGLDFYIETSAGNNEIGYKLAAVATDVTSTSEDFDLVAYGQQAGSGTLNETLRVTGRGTLTASFIGGEKVSIGDSVSVYNGSGNLVAYLTGTQRLASGGQYVWTSDANDAFSNVDTGLKRISPAVVAVSNGSAGLGSLQVGDGTSGAPAIRSSAGTTGVYFDSSGTRFNFASGGNVPLLIDSQGTVFAEPFSGRRRLAAITSTGTLANFLSREFVTNRGASGTVTLTMSSPTSAETYTFMRVANQSLRIEPHSGASFFRASGTTEAADKYLELGSTGALITIMWDGTNWLLLDERGTINVEP